MRDWLENRRAELIARGTSIDRPSPREDEPAEELSERQQKIARLIGRLTNNVPADVAERNSEEHARWLLAYVLDFHRREEKALWWEYFRLSDLSAEDLLEERVGLSGLKLVNVVGGTAKLSAAGDRTARRRGIAALGWSEIWKG